MGSAGKAATPSWQPSFGAGLQQTDVCVGHGALTALHCALPTRRGTASSARQARDAAGISHPGPGSVGTSRPCSPSPWHSPSPRLCQECSWTAAPVLPAPQPSDCSHVPRQQQHLQAWSCGNLCPTERKRRAPLSVQKTLQENGSRCPCPAGHSCGAAGDSCRETPVKSPHMQWDPRGCATAANKPAVRSPGLLSHGVGLFVKTKQKRKKSGLFFPLKPPILSCR